MTTDGIAHQVKRGISWNLMAAVLTNLGRLALIPVLGRTLTKADTGVVAAAAFIHALVFGVRDLGIGLALVQRKELTPAHVSTATIVGVGSGLGVTALMWFVAPWLALAYRMPEVTAISRGFSFMFLLSGLALVSRALVQRALRFRAIAMIDTAAYLVGATVAISWALTRGGPWSVVSGYLAEEACAVTAYLVIQPPPWSRHFERARLRELLRVGYAHIVGQIVGTIAVQIDNALVGRYLGAARLGAYSRAYDLVRFPSQVYTAIVGNVLFPSFSRMQDDQARLGEGFLRGLYANALILTPGSALLIVCAPEFIRFVLGPQWDEVHLPFRILAVGILFRTSQKLTTLLLQARGRVDGVAWAHTTYMITVIVGTLLTVPYGINAVAISTSAAIVSNTLLSAYMAARSCRIAWQAALRVHVPGLAMATATTLAAMPTATVARSHGWPDLAVMGATVGAALLAAGLTLPVIARLAPIEFAWLAKQVTRRRSP